MTKTVRETLRAAGNFNIFLELLNKAGMKSLGFVPACGNIHPRRRDATADPQTQREGEL
ncbi:MAG: hypothetical protein ACJ741_21470 [Pyrinomonadaceae bacterium]